MATMYARPSATTASRGERSVARILVIEADVPVRKVLRYVLGNYGYEVVEAANQDEGVAL
jgi:CheY-like chemotaxis protein